MVPDWVLNLLGLAASVIGGGAIWYFWDKKPLASVWLGFAFGVIVLLVVTLSIRNNVLQREAARRPQRPAGVEQAPSSPRPTKPARRPGLTQGWTLHRRDGALTMYFMADTSQMEEAVRGEFNQSVVPLAKIAPDLINEAQRLWAEVEHQAPRPEPPRTMIGPIVAELTEHLNHTFPDTQEDRLAWNYEYYRDGTAVKHIDPIRIPMAVLTAGGRATVEKLDRLAKEIVNRRYIEAVQRVTKK